ncbi:hypothetical protein BP5796_01544 [Coleophoma crateriformis]|uniref:PROP1-like PPR domain-containing protein n=1 Tax=Coleophoma crateriformis TaxID=565419 RepID=A0A3D8T0U8_9HELO|nr:hypothetical protein BP5796_01544 [Coleophoma crateriformis]
MPASRKSLKSQRSLHSAFWNHGGGDIEQSPLWTALIQGSEDIDQCSDRQQTKSSGVQRGSLLEFLYPAGTINLIRQYTGLGADRQDGRRTSGAFGKFGYRLYTSSAMESDGPTRDNISEPHVPGTHVASVSQSDNNWRRKASEDAESLETVIEQATRPIYEEVWRQYILLPPQQQSRLGLRVMKYLSTSPRIIDAERLTDLFDNADTILGSRGEDAYECAIAAYLKLRNHPRALQLYKEALSTGNLRVPVGSAELVSYFIDHSLWIQALDVWDSYHHFKKPTASTYKLWRAVVSLTQLPDRALGLVNYLENLKDSEVEPVNGHIGQLDEQQNEHAITAEHQYVMRSIDPAHDSGKSDRVSMSESVPGSDQPEASSFNNTVGNAAHVDHATSTTMPDTVLEKAIVSENLTTGRSNELVEVLSPAELPDLQLLAAFASDLFRTTLSTVIAIEKETCAELIRKLNELEMTSTKQYEELFHILLARGYRKFAVQCYRHGRQIDGAKYESQTLTSMLRNFCKHHSIIGMQEVLDDWFRWYGRPSRPAYKMCLNEFSRQGDSVTVHALFDQYYKTFKNSKHSISADELTPLLQVHSRRGEISDVIRIFNEIEGTYGLEPSIRCWNILLGAYTRVKDVEGAFQCFEQILSSERLTPDDYTFGTIMGMCASRGDLERVVDLYRLAESRGVKISKAMVDCLVLAHVRDNMLSEAEKIVEKASEMELKGSLTRMWNYVLTAYAMRRDLHNTNRILKKMSDSQVQFDSNTYSALMQALAMAGQPYKAYQILQDVMPASGVMPTSFHYAVVMGGFLAARLVDKVFDVHRRLIKKGISESASTRLLTFKAAAVTENMSQQPEQETYQGAKELFRSTLAKLEPSEWADTNRKGINGEGLDIAYPAAFNSYLIFVLSKAQDHEAVDTLVQDFKAFLPKHRQTPIAVLTALMTSQLSRKDYEGLKSSWDQAVKYAKTTGSQISDPEVEADRLNILYSHQLDLSRALSLYMNALFQQKKIGELTATVREVESVGFVLTNKNWNHYIQLLARSYRYKTAFKECETRLMPNWAGWNHVRWSEQRRNRLHIELRIVRKQVRHLYPYYRTLLYLARGFMEIEGALAEKPHFEYLFGEIHREFPRTIRAIETMQRTDEPLEREILRSY